MNKLFTRLWRIFRFPLILVFGSLPVTLVLASHYAPALLPWLWIWPVTYVLLDAFSTAVPGKWRIPYGVFEAAVLAGLCVPAAGSILDTLVILAPVMYLGLLLVALPLNPEARNERIHPLWLALCILVHIFGQLALYSSELLENGILIQAKPWLYISFFLFALLSLISLNQANLVFATNGRQAASGAMKHRNFLLVLGFFAIAAAISFVPVLGKLLGDLLKWIPGALWGLLVWLTGEQAVGESQGGQSGGNMTPNLPFEDSKQIPPWLNVIVTVLAAVLVAAALGYCLYFAVKKVRVFLRYLKRITGRYLHAVSEDYVDEITDTREDDDRSQRIQKAPRVTAAQERKLPPNERIRYRYRRLMQKHPEWGSGSTARENLPDGAAPLYERARYSSHPITQEDAQAFSDRTKKV